VQSDIFCAFVNIYNKVRSLKFAHAFRGIKLIFAGATSSHQDLYLCQVINLFTYLRSYGPDKGDKPCKHQTKKVVSMSQKKLKASRLNKNSTLV